MSVAGQRMAKREIALNTRVFGQGIV